VRVAITRSVPRSIDRCELTHLDRTPIDYARAVEEHERYEAALGEMGCRVERLPDAPDQPDSVFVEDTAVVFDDLAVIARPGAASRRGEVAATVAALERHRRLAFIQAPGTLDGGDVLVTDSGGGDPCTPPGSLHYARASSLAALRSRGTVFVGDTPRTNAEGARQLAACVSPLGYALVRVPVTKCLHLKSAVSLLRAPRVGGPALLINRDWIDASHFEGCELIDVDPSEPAAANVLAVGDRVLCADEFPRTRARVEAKGFVTLSVPAGELAKAEGGLTCGSLILTFNTRPA
jgi:dimethylargininase